MKTAVNVVDLAVPVRDSKNQIAGVLFARVSLNFLTQIASRTQVVKTGYSYVLDHRSVLISETGSKINPYLLQDLKGRSFVRELSKLASSSSGIQSPIVYRGWRGEEVMGTGAIVRRMQWMVVVEVPTAEAYAPVRAIAPIRHGRSYHRQRPRRGGLGSGFCSIDRKSFKIPNIRSY